MNIINVSGEGDPVDPEDWSPERTQSVDALDPGEASTQSWRLNTILEGDYMVYMVVISPPPSPDTTSHPITSPGIHVTVERFVRTNPGGVLPIAVGIPVLVGVVALAVFSLRRRMIDTGAPGIDEQ